MKKPIILSVLFFIITATSSFGQTFWSEVNIDPETNLKTGKIRFEIFGNMYEKILYIWPVDPFHRVFTYFHPYMKYPLIQLQIVVFFLF